MKSIKKFIADLFNDNNAINEKSVVGFIAFILLCVVLISDIVSGFMGKTLTINRFIFEGFLVIILGAFGISSIDKWINKTKGSSDSEQSDN